MGNPRERDGACLQLRLAYCPIANIFLYMVQWFDCQVAGALGLIRVLIYMSYSDGKTTMSIYERRASINEFYGIIFPSLLQLQDGISDFECRKQKEVCSLGYSRKEHLSHVDMEREEECGICLESTTKAVLPDCPHSLCLKCYRDWRGCSQSCPFCRNSLKRVNSGDLWICTDKNEVIDSAEISREKLRRLFMYIPLILHDSMLGPYDSHVR
ncbi:hypothetical protein LIER_26990 [Lithospermum erythrorhizon]|uniref:RING-type domain-containing protein n=1 Tax=Lithospermum erythrorhizon TaxID=34254 RepID=A0AAV3RE41_LITER